jgi:hypothetical protein
VGVWGDEMLFTLDIKALEGACCISGYVEYRAIEPESFELQRPLSILFGLVKM